MRRHLAVWAAIILAVLLTLWLIARGFAWGACSWYGYQTDRDTRYAAFVGCMVKVNNAWVPRNELRVMQ
jgi:hypothetical protein